MDAMREQNVKPSQLDPSKRNELKGYVEEILSRRLKNKKTVDLSVPLDVRLRSSLPGTKWRMAFTTQSLMAEALPKDATITLTFAGGSGSASTGSNKVDYGLDFFKTLALKRLVAKSTYSVLEVRMVFFCRLRIEMSTFAVGARPLRVSQQLIISFAFGFVMLAPAQQSRNRHCANRV